EWRANARERIVLVAINLRRFSGPRLLLLLLLRALLALPALLLLVTLAARLPLGVALLAPALAPVLPALLALFARIDLRHHRPVFIPRLPILEFGVRARRRVQVIPVDRRQLLLLFGQRRLHSLDHLDRLQRQRHIERRLGDDLRLDHIGCED